MMFIFVFLSIIFFILLIIKSRKYKKLKNRLEVTDNEFLVDSIRLYDRLKSKSVICDTTEIRGILLDYFNDFDNLVNDYFYPRVADEVKNEKE